MANVNKAVIGKSLLVSGAAAAVVGGALLYLDKKEKTACAGCACAEKEADEALPTVDSDVAE